MAKFEKLFTSGRYCDCSFTVGSELNNEIFEAHRLVLATGSPVFEAMLYDNKEKVRRIDDPIEVLDVQPNIFQKMLKYIYIEEIEFTSVDEACELYEVGIKYRLLPLLQECNEYFKKILCSRNVLRILELVRKHKDSEMLTECQKVIQGETMAIFKFPSFLDADISCLESLLLEEKLCILREIDVWDACVLWSKAKCEKENLEVNGTNQRSALEKVIHLIRFLVMDAEEFSEGPAGTNILTESESLQILRSISCNNLDFVPTHLCSNRRLRNGDPSDNDDE